MSHVTDQAPEPKRSIWRRICSFLVPKNDPDPLIKKNGFGWGWLVFLSVLGLALLGTLGEVPLAKTDRGVILLISLPVSAVIYLLLRKWIIGKGRYGNDAWKGSFWAGLLALPLCAFVVGLIVGLSGRLLPPDPARASTRPGLPELLRLLSFVVIVGGTVLIVHFISSRLKKSKKDRPTNGRSTAPFSSPEAAGRWTRGLLVATLVLAVLAASWGGLRVELLSRASRGLSYTMEEATRSDSKQQVVGILQILLFVGTAVAFLIWFHRMHKNLPSLGQKRPIFSPGWAVGFFFVPFLNFVRPFQAMRELWHGSDPGHWESEASSSEPGIHNPLATPPLVGWWWALFLLSNFISSFAARLNLFSQTPTDAQAGAVLFVVSDLLDIPGVLVAIRLVGRLTRWQREKARLISEQGTRVDMVVENLSSAAEIENHGRKKIKEVLTSELVGWIIIAALFLPMGSYLIMRNGTRTEEPQRVYVEGQYFTVGSTREEVLRIQGPPTLKLEFVWYYDDSYVQFDSEGKVNDVWNYSKNLKVKPWKLP